MPELPLPRDHHLLSAWTQALLREARRPRLAKRKEPTEDEKGDDDEDGEKEAETGFLAKKWSHVPAHLEEPEREYIAKRRKGLPSVHTTLALQAATNIPATAPTRKAKVMKADADGKTTVYEVLVPEGQVVEGEVKQDTEMTDAPLERAAPGTVIAGVGIANADGVIVANDLLQPQPPPRRRNMPPKRVKKGGPGRGKKKVMFTGEGQAGTSTPGGTGVPSTPATGDVSVGEPMDIDSARKEDGEGEDKDEEDKDDEDGDDDEDDEDREEGELSDGEAEETVSRPAEPAVTSEVPSEVASQVPSEKPSEVNDPVTEVPAIEPVDGSAEVSEDGPTKTDTISDAQEEPTKEDDAPPAEAAVAEAAVASEPVPEAESVVEPIEESVAEPEPAPETLQDAPDVEMSGVEPTEAERVNSTSPAPPPASSTEGDKEVTVPPTPEVEEATTGEIASESEAVSISEVPEEVVEVEAIEEVVADEAPAEETVVEEAAAEEPAAEEEEEEAVVEEAVVEEASEETAGEATQEAVEEATEEAVEEAAVEAAVEEPLEEAVIEEAAIEEASEEAKADAPKSKDPFSGLEAALDA